MSILSIIFFLTVFTLILAVGVWPCFALLAYHFGWQNVKTIRLTLAMTFIYIAIYAATGFLFHDIHRSLANLMGVLNFAFVFSAFYWVVVFGYWLIKKTKPKKHRNMAIAYLVIVSLVSLLASYNYHKPLAIEEFTLFSEKVTRAYRIVQVTDTQYGTATREEMAAAMQLAYAQQPDFIVFTGDVIDFDYYQKEDFASFAASTVPIYFERGNHEFYHEAERLMAYLNDIESVEVLVNTTTNFEEIQIIGIDYSREENFLSEQLAINPTDNEKFSLLLYHAPRELNVAIEQNIDLILAGHVHGGQIWPWTWVVDLMYEYADGAFQINNSFIYTSDGAALWGPRMRFGSQNEIAVFNIKPSRS